MFYNEILIQYTFDPQLAEAYGFVKKEEGYELHRAIGIDDLQARIYIDKERVEVHVVEMPVGMIYMPFDVATSQGIYVSLVREQVDRLMKDMVERCFASLNLREELLRYAKVHFGTTADEPWGKTSHRQKLKQACTLKTAKGKWYAIFMRIPYASLGLESEGFVDVMNLKADPEEIQTLVDGKHYFPAYHMNKKHWLTIILNRETNIAQVKALLHSSYILVDKRL